MTDWTAPVPALTSGEGLPAAGLGEHYAAHADEVLGALEMLT